MANLDLVYGYMNDLNFIYGCIERWLKIRRNTDPAQDRPFSSADAAHSALLHRLLSKLEPFEKPPPRHFSYPWYELYEKGYAKGCEVFLIEKPDETRIVINQNGQQWKLINKVSDTTFEVKCECNNQEYIVSTTEPDVAFSWTIELKK